MKKKPVFLNLVLTNKNELAGDVKFEDSLSCSDHEMVEFLDPAGRTQRNNENKQPWTSGELTLASSGTYLRKPSCIMPWNEEKSKRAGQYSSISSSRLKVFILVRCLEKEEEHLLG